MLRRNYVGVLVRGALAPCLLVLATGCSDSDDDSGNGTAANGTPQDIIEDTPGDPGSGFFGDDDGPGGSMGPGGPDDGVNECAGVNQEAEQIIQPVDVIFVIDNSSSMQGEIEQVEERINDDFARIIEESGLDYRVIMLARYGDVTQSVGGSDHPICIRAPLGAGDCSDPASQALAHNPDKFFHYSADIQSRTPLCDVLDGFASPDELTPDGGEREWVSIAPNGYSEFLRPDALKHFVVITDDNATCQRGGDWSFNDQNSVMGGGAAADAFHEALLELSPEQFGTAEKPNYRWHSIVGMAEKPEDDNGVSPPWQPDEPLTADQCPDGSVAPGTGFQALSVLTGGLRYPSCRNDDFDAIFKAIAGGVVNGALSCEWKIPKPPMGQAFDRDLVNVRFTPGGAETVRIPATQSAGDCDAEGGWHFDDPSDPKNVVACPATCETLKSDVGGRVDIEFGCKTQIGPPR